MTEVHETVARHRATRSIMQDTVDALRAGQEWRGKMGAAVEGSVRSTVEATGDYRLDVERGERYDTYRATILSDESLPWVVLEGSEVMGRFADEAEATDWASDVLASMGTDALEIPAWTIRRI